jgi:hypothetical protein
VHEHADLPARLDGRLDERLRQLGGGDVLGGDAAAVEALEGARRGGRKPGLVAVDLDGKTSGLGDSTGRGGGQRYDARGLQSRERQRAVGVDAPEGFQGLPRTSASISMGGHRDLGVAKRDFVGPSRRAMSRRHRCFVRPAIALADRRFPVATASSASTSWFFLSATAPNVV